MLMEATRAYGMDHRRDLGRSFSLSSGSSLAASTLRRSPAPVGGTLITHPARRPLARVCRRKSPPISASGFQSVPVNPRHQCIGSRFCRGGVSAFYCFGLGLNPASKYVQRPMWFMLTHARP